MASFKLISLNQVEAAAVQEGLPFWLFWFLMGVIGLLVFFIFLRDKDLRRRIDFFFLSAKNRSSQIHLRRQIKREKNKKERLWLELGQIVYENRMTIKGAEAIMKTLDSLERKKEQLLSQLDNFPLSLKNLPENIASAQSSSQELNQLLTPKAKELGKTQTQMEVKNGKSKIVWKKKPRKIEGKIEHIKKQIDSLFITLGRLADTFRFEDEELMSLYEKIDAANIRLSHLEQRLDSLHPF